MDEQSSPPSFQFYPRDFLTSRAVTVMTPEERGAYVYLLCHAWLSDDPGVLPDDDITLAALSGLGMERWKACSVRVRAAFRRTSREGREVLVQDRMVAERVAQRNRYEAATRGVRVTNEKRWRSVASDSPATSRAISPSSSSSSSREESKSKDAPDGAAVLELISSISEDKSLAQPRARGTPLMDDVKACIQSLPPGKTGRLYQLAGWLSKQGLDDECVLRFVADAARRLDTVHNFYAYYAASSAARSFIEGNYRADTQERESKRWKDEDWAWMRKLKAWRDR